MIKSSLLLMCKIISFSFLVFGCGGSSAMKVIGDQSCEGLVKYMADDRRVLDVSSWADREVLGKTFSIDQFGVGNLSGPGLPTSSLKLGEVDVDSLSDLMGVKVRDVRVFWKRDEPVEIVYLGVGRYRGILIGRQSLAEYPKSEMSYNGLNLVASSGRVGVICYDGED